MLWLQLDLYNYLLLEILIIIGRVSDVNPQKTGLLRRPSRHAHTLAQNSARTVTGITSTGSEAVDIVEVVVSKRVGDPDLQIGVGEGGRPPNPIVEQALLWG